MVNEKNKAISLAIADRVRKFANECGHNNSTIDKALNKAPGYIAKTPSISAEGLAQLIQQFPELSIYWVLLGDGDMLIHTNELNGDSCQDNNEPTENVETNDDFPEIGEVEDYQAMSYHRNTPDYVDKLLDLLKTKDAQISTLLEMLNRK
jgi:hypothetical protein